MKSFRDLFEERKRVNSGPTKAAIEDARKKLSQQFSASSGSGRSTPLLNTDIVSAGRTKGGSAAIPKNAPEAGVWLGSDDQSIRDAIEALRKQAQRRQSKSASAASDVSPEARTRAANTAARARETRPGQRRPLGDTTKGGPVRVTTLKPSKPAPAPKPEAVKQSVVSKKAAEYRKSVAKAGSKTLRSLQQGQETSARMGRGYSKSLAKTGDDIIAGIRAEKGAETAAGKAEFKKLRYGRGKSGPATDLRTPAQTRTYQTGVKKGYFDPKTGRVSETGLQKHVSMRAVGGENFGKFKGKDPRQALSKVSNITSRASAGDRAARSEVRRSYKAITAKYKPETGARKGGSASFRTFQRQVANINAPKLTPQKLSMPLPGTKQKSVSSPASVATKERVRQKLDLKLKAKGVKSTALGIPATKDLSKVSAKSGKIASVAKSTNLLEPPKTTVPKKQTTYRGIGTGKSVEVAGIPVSSPKKETTYRGIGTGKSTETVRSVAPKQAQAPTTKGVKNVKIPKPLPPKPEQLIKNVERGLKSPTKVKIQKYPKNSSLARSLVKGKQTARMLGRVAGPAFAAWDAYEIYKAERERGQTKERATKAALAKAGGGWAGSAAGAALGASIGSAVPVVGTAIGGIAGGIAGYYGGEKVGSALLGASKKDRNWMRWANRATQTGTSANKAQFKSGTKSVIRDKGGKERVGYLAYKDGKPVYKHGNDPKSLQYTSTNPLERLGRTFFSGQYKESDEAARRKRVAQLKASGSK